MTDNTNALLWAWNLERSDLQDLDEFMSNSASGCSDMGPELGIADFNSVDKQRWLEETGLVHARPPQIDDDGDLPSLENKDVNGEDGDANSNVSADGALSHIGDDDAVPMLEPVAGAGVVVEDDGVLETDVGASSPAPETAPLPQNRQQTKYLFPAMLTIAGLLHIFHNMLREMSTAALSHWPDCLKNLRVLNHFVSKRYYLDRFVEKCLGNPAASMYKGLFIGTKYAEVTEWRFLSVVMFLLDLLPLRRPWQEFWDASKYGRDKHDEGADAAEAEAREKGVNDARESRYEKVDSEKLTTAIESDFEWDYMTMLYDL